MLSLATASANRLAWLVPPRIRRLGRMSDTPWLSIIGIHEDGIAPVSEQAKQRLAEAEIILAPPRHLSHLHSNYHHPDAQVIPWPVPYQEGVEILQQFRGRKVTVLASGDPFHFGAATSLTANLSDTEWCCFPALSCFSLMANALGWPLEKNPAVWSACQTC